MKLVSQLPGQPSWWKWFCNHPGLPVCVCGAPMGRAQRAEQELDPGPEWLVLPVLVRTCSHSPSTTRRWSQFLAGSSCVAAWSFVCQLLYLTAFPMLSFSAFCLIICFCAPWRILWQLCVYKWCVVKDKAIWEPRGNSVFQLLICLWFPAYLELNKHLTIETFWKLFWFKNLTACPCTREDHRTIHWWTDRNIEDKLTNYRVILNP